MKNILEYLLNKHTTEKTLHSGLSIGDIITYDFSKNDGIYYIIMKFDSEYDNVIYTLQLISQPYGNPNVNEMVKDIPWERYAKNESYGYGFINRIKDVVAHWDIPDEVVELYDNAPEYYQNLQKMRPH